MILLRLPLIHPLHHIPSPFATDTQPEGAPQKARFPPVFVIKMEPMCMLLAIALDLQKWRLKLPTGLYHYIINVAVYFPLSKID